MGFFDDIPRTQPPDPEEWDDEPGLWIGGVVPLELLVAHTEKAAVVVHGLSAFPDGFKLLVTSTVRKGVKVDDLPWADRWHHGPHLPSDGLRFGLVWPDGGRATNVELFMGRVPDQTPTCGLEHNGGGGGGRTYEQGYWAWPLPAEGDLTVVVDWPEVDVPETRTVLDGGLLREAATRAHAVWDEDADARSHRPPWHSITETYSRIEPD